MALPSLSSDTPPNKKIRFHLKSGESVALEYFATRVIGSAFCLNDQCNYDYALGMPSGWERKQTGVEAEREAVVTGKHEVSVANPNTEVWYLTIHM